MSGIVCHWCGQVLTFLERKDHWIACEPYLADMRAKRQQHSLSDDRYTFERYTFCGRRDCHVNRESKMRSGHDRQGGAFSCDPCLYDMVKALNDAGIRTVASCCGHGFRPGNIALADGRELVLARNFDEARYIDRVFPIDINGQSWHAKGSQ